MGVSGCGKTTIGKLFSKAINIPFYDADDFHSQQNIDKMKNGFVLNDTDREPWLEHLSKKIKLWNASEGAILACSALKEKYRQQLSPEVNAINWIYLEGSYTIIKKRMEGRKQHYFKPKMLQSQFNALEVPHYGMHLSIKNAPQDIVTSIVNKIKANE